jgi:hypothetical protein
VEYDESQTRQDFGRSFRQDYSTGSSHDRELEQHRDFIDRQDCQSLEYQQHIRAGPRDRPSRTPSRLDKVRTGL